MFDWYRDALGSFAYITMSDGDLALHSAIVEVIGEDNADERHLLCVWRERRCVRALQPLMIVVLHFVRFCGVSERALVAAHLTDRVLRPRASRLRAVVKTPLNSLVHGKIRLMQLLPVIMKLVQEANQKAEIAQVLDSYKYTLSGQAAPAFLTDAQRRIHVSEHGLTIMRVRLRRVLSYGVRGGAPPQPAACRTRLRDRHVRARDGGLAQCGAAGGCARL
jgi:hypothetical protein